MIRFNLRSGIVAAIAILWASTAHAGGGLYHMPTDFFQCIGWGFGPGYHADLVLQKGGTYPLMHNRIVKAPVAPFATGVGCDDCGICGMSQLHGDDNSPMPFTEPPAPAAAAPASKPQVVPIANPTPSAAARPLPPLFPPPPLVVPVR